MRAIELAFGAHPGLLSVNNHQVHGVEDQGQRPSVNLAWGNVPGMGRNVIRLAESPLHPFATVDLQEPSEDGPRPKDLLTAHDSRGVGGYRSRNKSKTAIYFHDGGLQLIHNRSRWTFFCPKNLQAPFNLAIQLQSSPLFPNHHDLQQCMQISRSPMLDSLVSCSRALGEAKP